MVKKTFVTINLGKKNYFGQKIFLVTTIFDKKKLSKNFDKKNFQKIFIKKLSNKILVKKVLVKKFFIKQKFGQNKFWSNKIFGQNFSWSNKICGKKNVGQKNSLEVFFGDGCSCSCDKVTQSKL